MEEQKTPVEILLERGQVYAKTTIQLFKLKATDKGAEIVSKVVTGFVILIMLTLLFINLNIGIALFLGELLGKNWLGFMILAGFYGVVALVIYLFRDRWIKRPVSNSIIKELLDGEEFNDENLST